MICNHTKLLKILDTSIDCLDKRKQMMTKEKLLKYLIYLIQGITAGGRHKNLVILNYLKYFNQALMVNIRGGKMVTIEISADADGGPRSRVCSRDTPAQPPST